MKTANRLFTHAIPALLLICAVASLASGCKKPNSDGETNITTIQYQVSTDIFPNPERGFMHMVDVKSEGIGLNAMWLAALRADNVTLIMRQFYLDKFKDKAISESQFQLMNSDMQLIRDAGLKCVLRFAYTDDMAGTDAPLAIVEQHLDQLKPFFESNKDVIAFMQAGFIGAWGEWHSSSNGLATVENEKTVLFKLLSVLPAEIMVQVRTPGAKQEIFGSTSPVDASIAYTPDKKARIGHHNDCFLAGGTDNGTYSNIQVDKQYISKEALYVPTGGETCPPEGPFPDCATARAEMQLLKWTYLNLDWYQPVLAVWRNSGCFEEFQRSLGYRLVLMNAKLPDQVVADHDYNVEITLTNKGYAPLYNYKVTSLVFKDKTSGKMYPIEIPVDLRACKPNGMLTITKSLTLNGIPVGDYDLYLSITDNSSGLKNRIEYAVRLANTTTWDETTGMNNLKHQVNVTAK
jgi:hypothetical protein